MKWIYWILTVITIAVALPSAAADIRLQGFGTGLTDFQSGRFAVYGDGFNTVSTWSPNHANVFTGSRDTQFGISMNRPTVTTTHRFENWNNNYRTASYGDWQVQNVRFNNQPSQSAFQYRNTAYGPQASAVIGDYRGSGNILGFGRTSSHAYSQRYNTFAWSNPWAGSVYRQPASLSSYTAPPRAFY